MANEWQHGGLQVDLREQEESALAELTTPEGHTYKVGRLSNEERAQKILK